ncbi:hypothetical protein AWQ21_05570 [Picosynechococcus sp. PCC 7003]|uniref:hypothetical protein n=1 Tax=Picosynechococcus sp. PCC 7003 TaxID=374981 RepID=UPI0008104005|nr:hypothetical protein [Picosynechococcus sp. PCC 7003]ANV83897.1 hypothetical protein AWQ21_05570 [Picosynechococcus sp. PCC 7003]
MPEINKALQDLKFDIPIRRRIFIRNAVMGAMAVSVLSPFQKSLLAQAVDEEIVVYPGRSPEEIERELNKRKAGALADTYDSWGSAAIALGAAAFGLAVAAVEVPPAAVLLVLDGAAFVISGVGFLWLAHLMRMIAADPPRYPYMIDANLTDSFLVEGVLEKIQDPADQALLTTSDNLIRSVRSIWDHLEWWQAAKEQQDPKWMTIHSDQFWSSVDSFAATLPSLSARLRTSVTSLEARLNLPNNQSLFDATNQIAGRRLSNIPGIRQFLNKVINWDSELFDNGVREAVRDKLQNTVLQPVSESDFNRLLNELDDAARYFSSV